jgi:CRISPR-associated protein Csb2
VVVIEVQLLTGRYVAIADNLKATPDAYAEWPPHPARLYSALVAALHDRDPCNPVEREVLVQLAQEPPEIEVSNVAENEPVVRSSVVEVHVPVNDVTVISEKDLEKINVAKLKYEELVRQLDQSQANDTSDALLRKIEHAARLLQTAKNRAIETVAKPSKKDVTAAKKLIYRRWKPKSRTFPSAIPDQDTIRFGWPALDLDSTERQALAHLAERVTRLGHSSSLVRCALADCISPTLKPQDRTDTAEWVLRVPFTDQLDRLERAFTVHQAVSDRVLPSHPHGYQVVAPETEVAPEPKASLFSDRDWIVLAIETKGSVQLTRCVDVAKALHGALVKQAPSNTFISGRDANGKATSDPHLALVPLPDAGHEHAHGGVLGIALVMPRDTPAANRHMVKEALVDWELAQPANGDEPPWLPLQLHGGTVIRTRRQETPELTGLLPRTWCRPARRWLSATPVALDRNPGNLASRSPEVARRAADAARDIIREACGRVGLPAPLKIELSLSPLLPGSAPVRAFDPYPRERNRLRRVRLHVELLFEQPVRGPVLLGAGRFFGLGLFRPMGN